MTTAHVAPLGEMTERVSVEFARLYREMGHAPTRRELAAAVGLRSPGSLQYHWAKLVADGRITPGGKWTNRTGRPAGDSCPACGRPPDS